jgi:hypothetical protein
LMARYSSFNAASSVGKLPRVLMILRKLRCSASTALVTGMRSLGADVPPRYSTSWRMVRPSGQRHREHGGAGRPMHTMSREFELVAGRLCDSPGCAESANP